MKKKLISKIVSLLVTVALIIPSVVFESYAAESIQGLYDGTSLCVRVAKAAIKK